MGDFDEIVVDYVDDFFVIILVGIVCGKEGIC